MIRVFLFLVFLLFPAACGAADEEPSRPASEPNALPSDLLAVGQRAPDFSVRDQEGRTRTMADFRGKALVLYFYPRDATPGCTTEACAFRDAWDRIEAAGGQVVGVSSDDVESHAEFAAEHELTFPLLADTEGELAARYGVPSRFGFLSRVTFIVDEAGVIRRVFREVDPGVHAQEVVEVLESLAEVGD